MSPHETLKKWLKDREIAAAAFARLVGYDRSNFHRLLNGKLRPTLDLAHRIDRETAGKVPMSSWAETKEAVQDRAA
jgi:transcriptional regulator with XRE-family HTH domain